MASLASAGPVSALATLTCFSRAKPSSPTAFAQADPGAQDTLPPPPPPLDNPIWAPAQVSLFRGEEVKAQRGQGPSQGHTVKAEVEIF